MIMKPDTLNNDSSKMRSCFVISEYIEPEQSSTGYYWNSIIAAISKRISSLNVICAIFSTSNKQIRIPGVNYYVYENIQYNNNSLLSKMFNQIYKTLQLSLKIIFKVKKGDLIISGTNPSLGIIPIACLKPFIRFKWTLLVHDVFPDNLVPAGILTQSKSTEKLISIFNLIYSTPDQIITIGRDMQQHIQSKIKTKKLVQYIPNWVNLNEISTIDKSKSKIIQELGWGTNKVFLFFGNIGRLQGIESLLEGIKLANNTSACFLFIGKGASLQNITNFAIQFPHLNIRQFSNRTDVSKSEILSSCDVAIVSLTRNMKGLGVPSKAYFSLAANKFIFYIGDIGSEIEMLIREHKLGWCAEAGNPQNIADTINTICSTDADVIKDQPKNIVNCYFGEELLVKKFCSSIFEFYNFTCDKIVHP